MYKMSTEIQKTSTPLQLEAGNASFGRNNFIVDVCYNCISVSYINKVNSPCRIS